MTRLDTIERLCRHSAIFRCVRRLQQLAVKTGLVSRTFHPLAEALLAEMVLSAVIQRNTTVYRDAHRSQKKMYRPRI